MGRRYARARHGDVRTRRVIARRHPGTRSDPLLGACFAAMVVPTVLRQAPIYDTLRERTLRSRERANDSR
jgi:hypothetical protein